MRSASFDLAKALLYQALNCRIGLLLQTDDPAKARQLLYQVRNKIADPKLHQLQFRICNFIDGGNLAITKTAVDVKIERKNENDDYS